MISQEMQFQAYISKPIQLKKLVNVLQLKLSLLDEASRTNAVMMTILKSFNEVLQIHGKAFSFRNGDIFIVYSPRIKDREMAALVIRSTLLFADKLGNPDSFQRKFSLPKEKDNLLWEVSRISKMDLSESADFAPAFFKPAQEVGKIELTPMLLARVTAVLQKTEFSSLIRRQKVCVCLDGVAPQPMFEEVFVSIAELGRRLLPEVSLTATPWLFQDLTETLDKRVLTTVSYHDDNAFRQDFSLNLNISSILSREFEEFDARILPDMRSSIIFELQPIDIVSDFNLYIKARDLAHERGYKICIDNVSAQTIPFIDRERFGADFIKLVWNASLPSFLQDNPELKEKIMRQGMNRTILSRVDDVHALNFAKETGINLMQGLYLQSLLHSKSY